MSRGVLRLDCDAAYVEWEPLRPVGELVAQNTYDAGAPLKPLTVAAAAGILIGVL